jgi:two-component system LytT family sensor kinase
VSAPPADRRHFVRWALFFAFLALFWATENPWQSAFVGRRLGSPFGKAFFYWLVHWWVWGLVALGVARLARRFPPSRKRPGYLLFHLGAAVVVSILQILLMRTTVYAALIRFGEEHSFRDSLIRDFQVFAHKNLLTYAGIVAATLGLDAFRRAREHEVRTARLSEQLAQAELAALRMQLHPHFLFNSLHTAAELVHEDPAAAERSLLGLADLLRRALRASERAEVTLAEELEFADGYLALEGVRLEGKLAVEYRVPEALLDSRVPSLLLQPLVENAVRHGVARRFDGGGIVISALTSETAHGEALEITVENDAPGEHAAPPRAGTGIGLANVRARLAQLFGDAARLEVERVAPERFRARVVLPLAVRPSSEQTAETTTAPALASANLEGAT